MYLISFYSAVSYHQIKVDLHFIAKTLQGILIIKKKNAACMSQVFAQP